MRPLRHPQGRQPLRAGSPSGPGLVATRRSSAACQRPAAAAAPAHRRRAWRAPGCEARAGLTGWRAGRRGLSVAAAMLYSARALARVGPSRAPAPGRGPW